MTPHKTKLEIVTELFDNYYVKYPSNDSQFELIGSDMDDILDAINFINSNSKEVEIKPTDFQEENLSKPYVHKRNHNYSIFVKFEPEGDENKHIGYINDFLSENYFKCKLYRTK